MQFALMQCMVLLKSSIGKKLDNMMTDYYCSVNKSQRCLFPWTYLDFLVISGIFTAQDASLSKIAAKYAPTHSTFHLKYPKLKRGEILKLISYL